MKKTTIMRIASTLLIAVLLTTCAIGATFAKYVADATATDTARVAKWDVKIDGTTIAGEAQTFTFDLFNTVSNADYTTDDANVANAEGTNPVIIAPGTTGKMEFAITNDSEVTAKYWYTLSIENQNQIPLEFSLNGQDWSYTIADLNVAYENAVNVAMGATAETVTIYWRWAFEQTDAAAGNTADTTLGLNGTYTATVTLKVNAEQVD